MGWILNFQVHVRIIKKKEKKKMIEKEKKHDFRVKTRKGQSRAEMRKFSKTYGQSEQTNEGSTTRKHLKPPTSSSIPPKTRKYEPSIQTVSSLNFWVYHDGSWRLSNYHIQRLEKMNLFKMLDFQRICFSRKRPWKCATFLFNQICENESFEPDH